MLPWRKLRSSIIDSDKASRISDSAFRLYIYLIVAQDDEGNYPWTPMHRRRLTIGATWTDDQVDELVSQLVTEGLLHVSDGRLHVINGPKFNGWQKSQRRTPFVYQFDSSEQLDMNSAPQPVTGTSQAVTGLQLQIRREEKRTEREDPATRTGAHTHAPADPTPAGKVAGALAIAYGQVGMISPRIADLIRDWAERHPDCPLDWPDLAAGEAIKANALNWNYLIAVLDRWTAQGHVGKPTSQRSARKVNHPTVGRRLTVAQ